MRQSQALDMSRAQVRRSSSRIVPVATCAFVFFRVLVGWCRQLYIQVDIDMWNASWMTWQEELLGDGLDGGAWETNMDRNGNLAQGIAAKLRCGGNQNLTIPP